MSITKEEFQDYEAVRQSGVTNMFAVSTVVKLSGLPREKVFEIMERYAELKKEFFPEVQK